MDEDSNFGGLVKWALGATGLSAFGAAVFLPRPYGIYVAAAIVVLFLLLFGGYYLWQRRRARRQREQFTSAIEAQVAAVPKSISDAEKRAQLDTLRKKFQEGLQVYKSGNKDTSKLPWYVIIGESGSGKTEALRHSDIPFPKGIDQERKGTGGTVNMDWWFTNDSIILDTAGSMVFPEAGTGETPEWREFLGMLKKYRVHCPINGLFLVFSVESLIKDSSETIAHKASRMAQQLELIQRTLDVRFPVYLLVTKCDLLTGFREFFDSIDDPNLQHQIFGWSNREPLDAEFNPKLIDQHLQSIAERLRRRRLALLRDSSAAGTGDTAHVFSSSHQTVPGLAGTRRLDEVDALFALPESIIRLAPRLQRYLGAIFVAGPWSPKPVFLRGIYFTSSMREGKALDEAIADATGLPLDQLSEDRRWEKNRAFFLRDLFLEKVFRESGLVTRATNTLKLLRQRQFLIFGTAGAAMLLVLVFAGLAWKNLAGSVGAQSAHWQAGAASLKPGEWSPAIVSPGPPGEKRYVYGGTNLVAEEKDLTLIRYHQQLKQDTETKLATGLFTPLYWLGQAKDRPEAQRLIFDISVVRPLVQHTRAKMKQDAPFPEDSEAVSRHREALLALMKFEADGKANRAEGPIAGTNALQKCERYLKSFISYLTGASHQPDTNLVAIFAWTYAERGWPPAPLRISGGGDSLSNNPAIQKGLENLWIANRAVQTNIFSEVQTVNNLVDALEKYRAAEGNWLQAPQATCPLPASLEKGKESLDGRWQAVLAATNYDRGPFDSFAARYRRLKDAATGASAEAFTDIFAELAEEDQTVGIFGDIRKQIEKFKAKAGEVVSAEYENRSQGLDADYLSATTNSVTPSYQLRWSLYTGACALARADVSINEKDIGAKWARFAQLKASADQFRSSLSVYSGPFKDKVVNACNGITDEAERTLKGKFVNSYVELVTNQLAQLARSVSDIADVRRASDLFALVEADLNAGNALRDEEKKLIPVRESLAETKKSVLHGIDGFVRRQLGFPVLADSPDEMDSKKIIESHRMLQSLTQLLASSVWTNFPGGGDMFRRLESDWSSYAMLMKSLLNNDNTIAEWEISIFPHNELSPEDRDSVNVFRYLRVLDGPELDLTRGRPVVAKQSMDREITMSFRSNTGLPLSKKLEKWQLARFICNDQAEHLDNGAKWRIRIPLEEPTQKLKGSAVFDVQLLPNGRSLPKKSDWPVSRRAPSP